MPIVWITPDAADHPWELDTEHFCDPCPPLEVWWQRHSGPGIDRAWSELSLVPPAVFIRWQFAGPYLYFRSDPSSPERVEDIRRSFAAALPAFGSALGLWEQWCEPRVRTACDELAAADDRPFAEVAEIWGYGWHQTFTSYTAPDLVLDQVIGLLEPALGPDAMLVGQELVQGGANPSQSFDAEVWTVARFVEADARWRALVTGGTAAEALTAIQADPSAAPLAERIDGLFRSHAARSEGWDLSRPTWGERPELVLALVRTQLAGGRSPDEQAQRSREGRRAARARAAEVLSAADLDRCDQLLEGLEGYVAIREARAHWQMMLTGQLRLLALRHGRRLVDAGCIDDPEDVLYLEPPEFEASPGSLRELVVQRRADEMWWRTHPPPRRIGLVAEEPAVAGPVSQEPGVLIGEAASRGLVTAPARIILDPDDWERLEPGDVLVCPMSTPAWTPLFAVAGGIVTESGNAYAHPAITAREYGIPAVVAVGDACRLIADGQIITVDGAAGRVHLHPT